MVCPQKLPAGVIYPFMFHVEMNTNSCCRLVKHTCTLVLVFHRCMGEKTDLGVLHEE